MPSPQDEIEALKSQVASLTARVYQLEQQRGMAPAPPLRVEPPQTTASAPRGPVQEAPSTLSPSVPAQISPTPHPQIPARPNILTAAKSRRDDTDLEKKIGQYWLNRIGIVAMLVGSFVFSEIRV